jgi:hypothetical protein
LYSWHARAVTKPGRETLDPVDRVQLALRVLREDPVLRIERTILVRLWPEQVAHAALRHDLLSCMSPRVSSTISADNVTRDSPRRASSLAKASALRDTAAATCTVASPTGTQSDAGAACVSVRPRRTNCQESHEHRRGHSPSV